MSKLSSLRLARDNCSKLAVAAAVAGSVAAAVTPTEADVDAGNRCCLLGMWSFKGTVRDRTRRREREI